MRSLGRETVGNLKRAEPHLAVFYSPLYQVMTKSEHRRHKVNLNDFCTGKSLNSTLLCLFIHEVTIVYVLHLASRIQNTIMKPCRIIVDD